MFNLSFPLLLVDFGLYSIVIQAGGKVNWFYFMDIPAIYISNFWWRYLQSKNIMIKFNSNQQMMKFVICWRKVQKIPNIVNWIVQFNKINFWLCVFDSKDIGKAINRANI